MRRTGQFAKRPVASPPSQSRRVGDVVHRSAALFERGLLFKPDRARAIDRCIDYFGAPAQAVAVQW
jgi:hypothetical protein